MNGYGFNIFNGLKTNLIDVIFAMVLNFNCGGVRDASGFYRVFLIEKSLVLHIVMEPVHHLSGVSYKFVKFIRLLATSWHHGIDF
jgi:hypothetical protein